MAAARAFASRDPDESLRNPDHLADRLVGDDELALISAHPISKALRQDYSDASESIPTVMFAWLMLMRTRYIDEALKRAVANGVRQIVILGAGFDSRAYRFRDLLQHCAVVEIDASVTQSYKRQRLQAIGCNAPTNLTYASIDFSSQSLRDVLFASGIKREDPTFYIWEGVCMYLPEQSVRETLSTISSYSPVGSSLAMDYANQLWLEQAQNNPQQGSFEIFKSWGEPWIFGVPNPDGQEFFREVGMDPGRPMAVINRELIKRHTMNDEGKMYGANIFERMRAHRPAGETPSRPETYWLTELKVP